MEGFKPLSASNGRAGVALARRELPEVILCDVSMPELDGYGVLESLRADEATVSILRGKHGEGSSDPHLREARL